MIAALALTISGSLDIYEGTPKSDSLTEWKTGAILILVTWILQVFWALFSLMPFQGEKDAPGYQGGTAVSLTDYETLDILAFRLLTVVVYKASAGSACRIGLCRYSRHLWSRCSIYPKERSQPGIWNHGSAGSPHVPSRGLGNLNNDCCGTSHETSSAW
jgi:hypothetical protein